jgi:hypothetical protein
MVPMHLVSKSSRNDTHKPPIYVDNIDPSLTQPVASEIQGMRNLGVLEDQHRPQLDRNTLEKYKGQDDHDFDWSVKCAIDSAYSSGNAQDPQEPDASFLQDPYISLEEPLLHPEDTLTSVMWTMGNSDDIEIVSDEFLNLEEEKSRDSPDD